MNRNRILMILIFLGIIFQGFAENLPKEIKVKKIWDQAEHNAFTDLIRFKGNYYCSFREGTGHVPGADGKIRILKSADGQDWKSVALLESEGFDLRDAGLSVTPDGRIMVITGGSIYQEGKLLGRCPHVSFSNKSGMKFSVPQKVIIDPEIVSWGDWTWRVTWNNGTGYTMNYQIGPQERRGPTAMYLMKTTDGKKYEKVSKIDLDGFPNEAVIRFDKAGEMFVLIRRELEDQMGVFARSKAPFTQWDFKKMNYRLGGPNFLFLDDETIIAGTRLYEPEAYMGLLVGNKEGNFKKVLKLPSGGDTSYPGLVLEKNRLLVSYYSSHDGRASIYFAEIPLSYFEKEEKAPPMLNSTKIWNSSKYCAFTDLIRFQNKFYCTFREGSGHVPGIDGENGKIRVISSEDGLKWASVALIEKNGTDLRDPKLSEMPDGRLMITCGGSEYAGNTLMEWHTHVLYSENGRDWTQPFRVRGIPSNNWFFRLTWQGDTGYVAANICAADPKTGKVLIGYEKGTARKLIIYKTADGMNYEQVSNDIAPTPVACEATIKFRNDSSMIIFIRNAGTGENARWGMITSGKPPYRNFNTVKVDHSLNGQNVLPLEPGTWLVGTRENPWERPEGRLNQHGQGQGNPATVLLSIAENGFYERIFELPSGGDTSYPGFVIHENMLYISYYSSHEKDTAIYLSVVSLDEIKRLQTLAYE